MKKLTLKSKLTHVVFFLAGLLAFIFLVDRFGIGNILDSASRAGWSLVYLMILWFIIYIMNTLAWKLVMGASGTRISFPQLFALYVSGYALNTITPFLAVGGEPYRAGMLADVMDMPSSVSAVVLYRVINLFSHMLLLMSGILFGIFMIPMPLPVRLVLAAAFLAISGIGYWVFTVHRDGIFVRLLGWVGRFRLLRFVARFLGKHASELTRMDTLFTDAYRHRRKNFVLAVILEYITRALMGVEIYIILQAIGISISLGAALFVYVTYSIIINVVFFIPLNLGIRESGLMLGLQSLAVTPLLGVYIGVVIRIRELFWILVGLSFMLISTLKRIVVVKEVH